jgi:nucleoside-diphosphate-sugar epimerase
MVVDWPQERVVLTGGAGFLGNHVVEGLRERGCKQIVCPRSREYDLVQMDAVERLYRDARPSLVLHLAARVGGIGVKARGAAQVKKRSARVLSYDVIRSRRATADIVIERDWQIVVRAPDWADDAQIEGIVDAKLH